MGRPPKNKKEKLDDIRERKSNFAKRLLEQRRDAQERLKAFRGNLDSGVKFSSEPEGMELEGDDSQEGREIFNEFSQKPKAVKNKQEEESEDLEDNLDADEKIEESKTQSGKPVNEFVFEYYQGFKKAGLSGQNAAVLTLATILAEVGIVLKRRTN